MGKVISVNLQKGGVGKTTTACCVSYILSNDYQRKVLLIDFDSQGNASYIATQQSIYDFTGKTVKEAIMEEEDRKYIISLSPKFDLLPANDFLATLPRFLYSNQYHGKPLFALRNLIHEIRNDYDFIIIDTPPNLGDLTLNALLASDYCIIPCETSMLSFLALDPMNDLIQEAREYGNHELNILGIVVNVVDSRRKKENFDFIKSVDEYYPDLRFNTVITENTDTSRLANIGLFNRAVKKAVKPYIPLVKEIMKNGRF